MGMKSATSPSGQKTVSHSAKVRSESRQRRKLLVVDDDLCMRETAALFLVENGYACTITSESAVGAMDRLKSDRFDLIITDLHMPEMDGMALLEWVKARWPHTKVMIITGDMDVALKGQALKKGVDSYLAKPFSLDQFLREVDDCLVDYSAGLGSCPAVLSSTGVSC